VAKSAVITIVTSLLAAWFGMTLSARSDPPLRTHQTLRVRVPGEIRITASTPDSKGKMQTVRISAGMDVSVQFERHDDLATSAFPLRDGQSVCISISRRLDADGFGSVPRLTILPGW
jgi:hypothetical protein